MPPRRKKTVKNEMDRAAKLASKLGFNIESLLEDIPLTEIGAEAVERRSVEAESVLFYIETQGKGFVSKNCRNCGLPFLHTYFAVDYCSEDCRAYALAEKGIIWNFHRRTDAMRWNVYNKGYVPKIIGAGATEALKQSDNLHTNLPTEDEVFEETEETPEIELPLQGIPEGSSGPVDDYERRAEAQERFESMLAEEKNSN